MPRPILMLNHVSQMWHVCAHWYYQNNDIGQSFLLLWLLLRFTSCPQVQMHVCWYVAQRLVEHALCIYASGTTSYPPLMLLASVIVVARTNLLVWSWWPVPETALFSKARLTVGIGVYVWECHCKPMLFTRKCPVCQVGPRARHPVIQRSTYVSHWSCVSTHIT